MAQGRGGSLRKADDRTCRSEPSDDFKTRRAAIFDLREKAKIKCSDMRRFGISFFLLFLLSAQNSNAQDFVGWPNFNSVPNPTKNPETKTQAVRSKKKSLPQKQIVWQAWKDLRTYRYRTGSRYAGRGNWERYIIFESPQNVHFSEIFCGSAKAPDVLLSPSNRVAKIVLLSTSASHWKWNASLSSTRKVPEHN
jgi:hypothetical protein